jgi:hypothetical protein
VKDFRIAVKHLVIIRKKDTVFVKDPVCYKLPLFGYVCVLNFASSFFCCLFLLVLSVVDSIGNSDGLNPFKSESLLCFTGITTLHLMYDS